MDPLLRRIGGMDSPDRAKLALLIVPLALAAALWASGAFGTTASIGPERASAADLQPFTDCDELRDYVDDHRWALQPPVYYEDVAVDAAPAAGLASRDSVGVSDTGTNVQERGIDEPDMAKLSGDTLFVAERGELRSYDVSGEQPVELDRLKLGDRFTDPELLVAGDRALALSHDYRYGRSGGEVVTQIDVADPAAMRATRELEVDGTRLSARLVDDTVHLALSSDPGYRENAGDGEGSGPPRWLPETTITDLQSGESSTEPLLGCEDIAYPERFAGIGVVSVLTLDMDGELGVGATEGLLASGGTVYESPSSLYVATEVLAGPRAAGYSTFPGGDVIVPQLPQSTTIHRFDVSDPTEPSYASSGRVDGRILNEWALSEYEGDLRVATTTGDAWAEGPGESESAVTVLAERDGALERVGGIDGLGRGEQIFGVRFIGEMGYVVTFEQTDPLYAVDLSDPGSPQLTGELKIPGYSAYLHPVGEGRLLGIGQGGRSDGTITGAQGSLFDVGDAEPRRLATLDLDGGGGYSSAGAQWDHHAFSFSPERSIAVVPVSSYGPNRFNGAVAIGVEPDGDLDELGRLESDGQIERTFMSGERLITVTRRSVTSTDLDALANASS